ncbi:MAG: DNA-binding beta-propeller fold protein YncE [Flavobacteriales bacterium]|jgi:DNA-binding beta-propeller fold protein YncE
MKKTKTTFVASVCVLIFFVTCSKEKISPEKEVDYKKYPTHIGDILLTKCAVSGCHNDASKEAAAGLSLSSWDKLFEGSRNGNATIIPFRADQSFLMFSINTFSELGPSLIPTMPYNAAPLSKQEVKTIRDWIEEGAPNVDGFVKFSDPTNRKKIYVTNQGCDLVGIIDAETKLLMRYVDVGVSEGIESPHMVKVSPSGDNWYVCFYSGNVFQKFNSTNDKLVGTVDLGQGSWNTFAISSDNKTAFVVDWNSNGSIAVVDLENMSLITRYQGGGLLQWPHGITINSSNTALYVTSQLGNFIYKIDITNIMNPEIEEVSLETGKSPNAVSSLDPHEIYVSPNKTHYFVTCQKSNEVRVLQVSNDSLVAIIPTGIYPQEISFSSTTPYAFVSCTEDSETFPGKIGSVSVIDFQNFTHVKSIFTGYQPHGIAVDDEKKLVYVANRNANPDGPSPHHSSDCGGRNGNVTMIDMHTLELIPNYKAELSVDPYYVAIRF